MLWIGWLVAVLASGVALGLHRRLRTERAHGVQLLYAKIDAENQRDALQNELVQAADAARHEALERLRTLGDLAGTLQDRIAGSGADFSSYRERVRRFDAAVQYCLQPVELIFGADKAGLDELVRHVEGARRGLFEARAAMEQHPLHRAAEPLAPVEAEVRALRVFVHGPQQDELPLAATG
ncbi:hypothetical protein [Dokdonella sp.]|uniref:hypothetical protein n=1 Tax=Dokdonella sp. TaxID=2291710 RepID=UPI002635E188|nr:hypothetical protein [Dokdonella sp.]